MPFWSNAVNRGFDAGIEQFNNHDKDDRASQQHGLNPVAAQPEGGWQQDHRGDSLLPKSGLLPTGTQPGDGVPQSLPDAFQSFAGILGIDDGRWFQHAHH